MASRSQPVWKIFARLSYKDEDSGDYARECYAHRVIAVGQSAPASGGWASIEIGGHAISREPGLTRTTPPLYSTAVNRITLSHQRTCGNRLAESSRGTFSPYRCTCPKGFGRA